jgi:hypothetical protein
LTAFRFIDQKRPESLGAVGAFRSQALSWVLEWIEKRLYAAATPIVTVGDKRVPGEKICVISNGVDRESLGLPLSGKAVRRVHNLADSSV